MSNLHALVIAGGRGQRFWPLSRRHLPKQCISLSGARTLLQETIDRLAPLIPPERIFVVTGVDMEGPVREQLTQVPDENILVEPSGRNTAPCIGWGAVEIGRRAGGDTIVAVLPADHRIDAPEELRRVLAAAEETAQSTNAIITLGITPTRPETGFGYMELGSQMGVWRGRTFSMVERFTEKPNAQTAGDWVRDGRHVWNAGMFVFGVDTIRDAFRSFLPRTSMVLEEIQRNPSRITDLWDQMEAISIDYGILERSRHILCVTCDIGWSDVGGWEAAGDLMPIVDGGRGVAARVMANESDGCIVHAPNKVVVLLGVKDIVVVDTEDAILVMDRAKAQELKEVVCRLELEGLTKHT